MLGYSVDDITHMQIAIANAISMIPAQAEATKEGLRLTNDLLVGLVVEGHI